MLYMFQIAVNSNKHAIYINFLCHIFIHFGQFSVSECVCVCVTVRPFPFTICDVHCSMSNVQCGKYINMQWHCFNRNGESVAVRDIEDEKSPFASN